MANRQTEEKITALYERLSRDDDLTHVGDIEDTTVMPHGVVLIYNRCVLYWHIKACERLHECAHSHMARMETSLIHKSLQFSKVIFMR